MNEADFVVHRALIERIGAEKTVDIAGPQIGHHFGRRCHPDLHIGIGVHAVLRQVVAQQKIVHRVLERHRQLEALPLLRVALVLMFVRQGNGLTVHVLDGGNPHLRIG